MPLQLGVTALDFTQDSQLSPFNLRNFAADNWEVLFSHPTHDTLVCTNELGVVARLLPEWEKRNIKTIKINEINFI